MGRYGNFRREMTRKLGGGTASSPTPTPAKSSKATQSSPPLEHEIQKAFVSMVNVLPDPAVRVAFAIPNAAKRSYRLIAMLKAEGFRAGMPDWCLPVPRGQYCALWIEFKRPGEKARPEQAAMHDLLRAEGASVQLHTDANEALKAVRDYLSLGRQYSGLSEVSPQSSQR